MTNFRKSFVSTGVAKDVEQSAIVTQNECISSWSSDAFISVQFRLMHSLYGLSVANRSPLEVHQLSFSIEDFPCRLWSATFEFILIHSLIISNQAFELPSSGFIPIFIHSNDTAASEYWTPTKSFRAWTRITLLLTANLDRNLDTSGDVRCIVSGVKSSRKPRTHYYTLQRVSGS